VTTQPVTQQPLSICQTLQLLHPAPEEYPNSDNSL